LNQRQFIVHTIDGGIIAGADSNQQVGVGYWWQLTQNLRQVLWTKLGRSTGTGREFCQADRFVKLSHVVLAMVKFILEPTVI
jgi:hypothetical protein